MWYRGLLQYPKLPRRSLWQSTKRDYALLVVQAVEDLQGPDRLSRDLLQGFMHFPDVWLGFRQESSAGFCGVGDRGERLLEVWWDGFEHLSDSGREALSW